MALKKEITTDKGITSEYHRISQSVYNATTRKSTIVVRSYRDESYRQKEKDHQAAQERLEEIFARLAELWAKGDQMTDEDREEEAGLRAEQKELEDKGLPPKEYFVCEANHGFEFSPDEGMSEKATYEKLKSLPDFEGAEDC